MSCRRVFVVFPARRWARCRWRRRGWDCEAFTEDVTTRRGFALYVTERGRFQFKLVAA